MNGNNIEKAGCRLVIMNSGKRFYRVRLSGAKAGADLDELVNRIIRLNSVAEVDIEAENPGNSILIMTRFKDRMEPQNAATFIANHIGTKFGRISTAPIVAANGRNR